MKAAVKKNGINWPIAQDGGGKMLEALQCNAFPTLTIIDRKGKVRVNDIDDGDIEKAIKMLLKEKG
jgi:hypothetical protein